MRPLYILLYNAFFVNKFHAFLQPFGAIFLTFLQIATLQSQKRNEEQFPIPHHGFLPQNARPFAKTLRLQWRCCNTFPSNKARACL